MAPSFDTLPEVAMARALLRAGWGLELGLAAADGGGYATTSHAGCDTIRGARGGACAGAMREVAARVVAERVRGGVVHRCHAGLVIVAAPVRDSRGLAAIVYASGAVAAAAPADLGALFGEADGDALAARLPPLSEVDLGRVRDLVVAAAAAAEAAIPAVPLAPPAFTHPFTEIVGDAPAVRDLVALLAKVVKSDATVLVHGESGTGKELIARALHYHGPRAKKPFVVQNCSALNDNLLESALFGHTRGSFTGAVKDQKGLFEVADGGTFFLDEIGDMSPALQVKLLRVLQEGTLTPVGGTKPIKVDVRIIAASHKDLQALVARREFREDLFYRVNVLKITVPPLRDRPTDIPRLVEHFIRKHHRTIGGAAAAPGAVPPRVSEGALARLLAYPWPGNIRELENEIERMLVLGGEFAELSPSTVSARVAGAAQVGPPLRAVVDAAETAAIIAALGRTGGDRAAAASQLGVSRAYLEARAAALGLGGGEAPGP